MSKLKIQHIVAQLQEQKDKSGEAIEKQWLVSEAMKSISIEDDESFFLECVCDAIWKIYKAQIKSWMTEERSAQMNLQGFEHIKERYQFIKDGKPTSIALEKMSAEEFDEKIAEHLSSGNTRIAHADELSKMKLVFHSEADPQRALKNLQQPRPFPRPCPQEAVITR